MNDFLPVGKLDMEFLASLLDRFTMSDDRILVGSRVGGDATVIDFGDSVLVVKTDPVTFATDEIGWYAVNVNANDIASMGAIPKWFLGTFLFPPDSTTKPDVEEVFRQVHDACQSLGVVLCGGHTEVTHDLTIPIVVGNMLGEAKRDEIVSPGGARVGDDVILTKGIAIEATSIIAREKSDDLLKKYPPEFVERCRRFLKEPGISVVKDAQIATQTAKVHAMHDPTEGGLATGLHEIAKAARVGLEVFEERIPIFPETVTLCAEYGIDPLGVIASGALLIAVDSADSIRVVDALEAAGIPAAVIARVLPESEGLTISGPFGIRKLPRFDRDQIAMIF